MSIQINCEWCNKAITEVSYKNVREYVQKNGEVCKKCLKRVDQLDEFFNKKRERFMKRFDKLLGEAKTQFSQEVKRLSNGE